MASTQNKPSGDVSQNSTYKSTTAGEIAEMERQLVSMEGGNLDTEFKVWALKNGAFTAAKQTGDDVARFKPFRMVIVTRNNTMQTESSSAPRMVSLIDDDNDDNSNTSGIDCVASYKAAFEVIGAEGEIIIISDADCGMVDIYDLTGRMIATADVKGGEIKVRVQTGVYIVAGQKVMVR